MSRIGIGFFVGLCGLLVACHSTGRNYTETQVQETLEIEILPNTSKMFVYRLRWPEDSLGNRVHIDRGEAFHPREEGGGVNVSQSTAKRLHENTAFVVAKMGYCREGFLEIDSSLSRYHLWMKGECKDGATDEDRKKFGDKQTLPVRKEGW